MYTIIMLREKIKKILINYYGVYMVDSILSGRRKPNLDAICDVQDKLGIPVHAWKDIKSFLNKYDTKSDENKAITNRCQSNNNK